jgi:hypothetical protein
MEIINYKKLGLQDTAFLLWSQSLVDTKIQNKFYSQSKEVK